MSSILQTSSGVQSKNGSFSPPPEEHLPDYRSKKAVYLFNKNVQSDPDKDEWVNRFLSFYGFFDQADGIEDIYYLQFAYPDVYPAFRLRRDARDFRDSILEAGILSGATIQQLAEYTLLEPSSVIAYEKCYYDIRDYTASPGYVFGYLLSSISTMQSTILVEDTIWKAVAYAGGWDVFKDFLSGDMDVETSRVIFNMVKSSEGKKLLVASHREQLDGEFPTMVMDRYIKIFQEATSPTRGPSKTESEYKKIQEQLSNVKLVSALQESDNFETESRPEGQPEPRLLLGDSENNGDE